MAEVRRERALTAIIAYKLGRAGLAAVGVVVFVGVVISGQTAPLHDYAVGVHEHAVSALALSVSKLAISAADSKHILVAAAALAIDAAITFVEGLALLRGWRWGPWLVVGASGALLPFELVALVRHVAIGRLALLLINAAIVAWLLVHAIAHHRRPRPAA